jgi:hypothetical protein
MSDIDPEFEEMPVMKGGGNTSFFSYMFSLSSTEKNEIINAMQYILIVIIPIVILLKLMKNYIPLENPDKGTIEITVEVILQLFIIFIAFLFIHKFAVFIPTYSTVPYGKMNLIHIIIPVLFLLLCMKSSISEKMSILLDRFMGISGLAPKENMEEKKNPTENQQNQIQFPPPPQSTMIVKEPGFQGGYQQGGYQQGNQNQREQNFGPPEPMPANEMFGINAY